MNRLKRFCMVAIATASFALTLSVASTSAEEKIVVGGSGSLTDEIATPGQRMLGSLGTLGVDNGGNFFDTSYGSNPGLPGNSTISAFNPVPKFDQIVREALLDGRYAGEWNNCRSIHVRPNHQIDKSAGRLFFRG